MIKAIIFDLDGTLVQTEELKAISYARAAKRLCDRVNENDVVQEFTSVVGWSRREVAMHLLDRFHLSAVAATRMEYYGVSTPWQAFVQVRQEAYDEMLYDPEILIRQRIVHNIDLVDWGRKELGKVGLATMSYCPQVRTVLDIVGLHDKFDFIASRDDVENGKPHPEIYQLVACELGVQPHECLVIEDSVTGIKAALNAGMRCIAVTTHLTRDAVHRSMVIDPRWIVDDPAQLVTVVGQVMQTVRVSDQWAN